MRGRLRAHPVLAYALLAYALTWAWWVPMALRGDVAAPGVAWPTHLPGLLGPGVAALVVTAGTDGRAGVADLVRRMGRWRVGWGWWLLVVATAGLALLALVVPRPDGGPAPSGADFGRYTGIGEIGLVAVLLIAFVVNGLGEETGWRGFAADRLVGRHGLVGASLLVTLLWAGWHVPMFWVVASFRDFGPAGTVGWLLGLAAGSIVLTWLYLRTGRSVLYVAAWHTAFNVTAATAATAGLVAAVSSTLVMIAAAGVVVAEVRKGRSAPRGDASRSPRRGR